MNPAIPDWNLFYGWVTIALFTGIISFLACNVLLVVARQTGRIAKPGKRQSHAVATPTGGGLGILLGIMLVSVCLQPVLPLPGFWWWGVLPGVILLTVVGWRDDRQSVSAWLRLFVQLVVSLWLLGFSPLQFSLGEAGWLFLAVIAMVWSMNLYNFMDGSHGMAGFQAIFAGVTMAALFQSQGHAEIALLSVVVAAASAGFLPLNFPVARVFMGDVASVPLGFIFAALSVYGITHGVFGLPMAILIMSLFIVDATLTLLTRVIRREQWYTAHAQHVYQLLIVQGWSHRRVLVVYQAINLVVILPAIVLIEKYPQNAMQTSGLTLLFLGSCWYFVNRRLGMLAKVQMK